MTRTSLLLPLLALVGCPNAGSRTPEVIDVRHVSSAGGSPSVDRVVDMGSGKVPRQGRLDLSASDGHAVIGELLLLWGSSFGKQPSVTIGGRAADVLAHVRGGGIVVRVPWGIDPGAVKIEVSNREGAGSTTFPVRRLALVLDERGLQPLELGADGSAKTAGGPLPLPGAQKLAFSHDGSVAYVAGVAGGKVKLWIVDLGAKLPTVVGERTFPGTRLVDLETAAQADLGLLVSDTHLVYFDNGPMLNPAFYAPHALPAELVRKQVLAAAVGGWGRAVALLLADLNQVALIDASKPTTLAEAVIVDALPEARLQVVDDLRFSPEGRSIWVLGSDTERSIAGGYQTLQLSLLQRSGERELRVHETWKLTDEHLAAPALALARGEPIPPGTSIRPEPSSSAVYAPAWPSDLLKEGFAAFLKQPDRFKGRVLRSSLTDRAAQVVAEGAWLPTSVDVVGQTEVMLALGLAVRGGRPVRVLVHGVAWRGGAPRITELGAAPEAALRAKVPWLGEVRAQP